MSVIAMAIFRARMVEVVRRADSYLLRRARSSDDGSCYVLVRLVICTTSWFDDSPTPLVSSRQSTTHGKKQHNQGKREATRTPKQRANATA